MQFFEKNENVPFSDTDVQWHPAFCAAAELELSANRADLDFQREYNLSKKPLQIDLLVVKKRGNARIENQIGQIFRQYNIVEYKSPDDGLTIDDFFKTLGYACIYKALGETVDQVPADQMTVSLFRENHPRELFRSLERYGFKVKKKCDGVYYITGLFIPAQLIVTRELEGRQHRSLRVLSRNALVEDIMGFTEDARRIEEQGERENVEAVLHVSMAANYELYEKTRREFSAMNDVMRWMMRDEMAAELQKGRQQGIQQGMQMGKLEQARETAYKLHDMGLSADKIAGVVNTSVETVQEWFAEPAALAK